MLDVVFLMNWAIILFCLTGIIYFIFSTLKKPEIKINHEGSITIGGMGIKSESFGFNVKLNKDKKDEFIDFETLPKLNIPTSKIENEDELDKEAVVEIYGDEK